MAKKKSKKRGGVFLGLVLGGAVLLLGVCGGGGLLYFRGGSPFGGPLFGGGLPAESKYFPDECAIVNSERTAEIRKTRFHEAAPGLPGPRHGVKQEDIERITSVSSGWTNNLHIITTKRPLTPDEIKDGLATFGNIKSTNTKFDEENVGGQVMHVGRKGTSSANQCFCLPESNIVLVGPADALRKILTRGNRPPMTSAFAKAYNGADFNCSRVNIGTGKYAGPAGFADLRQGKVFAEATCIEVTYGAEHASKLTLYYKDSAEADVARKDIEETLKQETGTGVQSLKEARKNAKVRASGSTVTISTSVREQTAINDVKPR